MRRLAGCRVGGSTIGSKGCWTRLDAAAITQQVHRPVGCFVEHGRVGLGLSIGQRRH